MTTMRTPDGREFQRFERADDLLAAVRAGRDAWLDGEIDLARKVLAIAERNAYFVEGASSAVEFMAQIGYDGHRVFDLLLLARAIQAEPQVEALLRAKRIVFQAAVLLGKILPYPQYLRPDDEWLRRAELSSLRDLRRAIHYRIELVKQQARTLHEYTALVDERTRMQLDRCQEIASRRANLRVSRGQTMTELSDHYLATFDPVEQAVGTRRVGPTAERPEDRYVPRAVVAEIWRRSDGYCEVGGCPRIIEELCHLRAHAGHRHGEPSGREETDLFGACRSHHKLYDAGYLHFHSWIDGRPAFYNRRQESIYPAPRTHRDMPAEWLMDLVRPEDRVEQGQPCEPPACEPPACEPPACEPPACEPPACEPPADEPPPVVMDRANPWPPEPRRAGHAAFFATDLGGASLARDRGGPPRPGRGRLQRVRSGSGLPCRTSTCPAPRARPP